ncbi:Cytochrome P450 CYP72A219 like [Actinidia chinensis var. chinensis]|uniref:Cytochrome P450 CYP72A219 like n=1 Tax=Actinidia chinensis var. chinensis TaxID=1590841 RepID=A0A2R6P2Z1_ACTCC|nr:Cytochrome P450 CYP72A219 like [Actinidia chinensis var. chinensis]
MDGGVELAMVEAKETREGVEEARFKGISISGFIWRTQTNDEHLNTSSSNQTSQPPLQSYPATCPPFLQSSPHKLYTLYAYQSPPHYGKRCFSWDGTHPTVMIMEPELVDQVLVKNNHFRKPTLSPTLRLLLSGLAGYEGEKWAKHRKIMNPAFYLDKLKHMLPAMHMCCSEMIAKWEELVSEKGGSSCEVDVSPDLQNLAANVIARTAFGSSYQQGRRIFELQSEQALRCFQYSGSIKFPGQRFIPTKLSKRIKEISDEVQGLVRGMIHERERAMKEGEVGEDDLLSVLLKANTREIKEQGNNKKAGMSIDDVIQECKLMYFVGQETSAQLLVWAMILLSIHPNWQMRAREEVRQVFGTHKPGYDGIIRLRIVTMILNEVLRLYPPAIMMTRVNSKKTNLGEMVLPAGTRVMIPILFIHHDRDIWGDDADEFKPERFSEGIAKASKKPASFLPFGWGPRICIGNTFALLEAKMALAMILQHFSFELSPSYTHSPCFQVTLQPQNGAHLILHKI